MNSALVINYWLPLLLKIIKICFYGFGQILFIYKARKKEESIKFEVLVSFFFLFMNIGSILEVVTQNFYPEFYNGTVYLFWPALSAEALVYFFGFIAIGILTLGTELNSKIKTHGILSIIPFLLAAATLYFGIQVTNYIYFLALVVIIVPLLYFYIAIKVSKGFRKKSYCVAVGYLLIFLGEATNYSILTRVEPFKTWVIAIESSFGYQIAFLQPMVIIIGLLLLFYGYKTS